MTDPLAISPEVAEAIARGAPVVALESSIIATGLPVPHNLDCARAVEAVVRREGAVPATIAVLDGRIRIGCDDAEIRHLAQGADIAKASRRDLSLLISQGRDGATTVAATMVCAARAGIALFATGGIGGVHRGAESSFDVSADLIELGRTPVAVVCSGAKSILDLPKTREVLETQGVPVVGYGIDHLPAFYVRDSGLPADTRMDGPGDAARLVDTHLALGLGGMVIGNPVPADSEIETDEMTAWLDEALSGARAEWISGKNTTPYLLARVAELSGGRTLATNIALIEDNAAVAARIAVALSQLRRSEAR